MNEIECYRKLDEIRQLIKILENSTGAEEAISILINKKKIIVKEITLHQERWFAEMKYSQVRRETRKQEVEDQFRQLEIAREIMSTIPTCCR